MVELSLLVVKPLQKWLCETDGTDVYNDNTSTMISHLEYLMMKKIDHT